MQSLPTKTIRLFSGTFLLLFLVAAGKLPFFALRKIGFREEKLGLTPL